jgi:hypothetical protein
MSEFYVGQQVVVKDEGMGTIRSIETDFREVVFAAKVWIDGDPANVAEQYRIEDIQSYVDVYTSTDSKDNVFVGPFAAPILKGLIENWLNLTHFVDSGPKNKDYPFDEEDSFSWAVLEMKDILERIS